jgi:hypothetical protein
LSQSGCAALEIRAFSVAQAVRAVQLEGGEQGVVAVGGNGS